MIYQMDTEDILRLVAKYYSVHQILWDGPISTSNLKKRLMEEYHLPESTAMKSLMRRQDFFIWLKTLFIQKKTRSRNLSSD